MRRHQIVVIGGGESFKNYHLYLKWLKDISIDIERYRESAEGAKGGRKPSDWKSGLGVALGRRFDVIKPEMPNKLNAKYSEWKIIFEKIIPHISDDSIFIGHSLGATFLAKYFAESGLRGGLRGKNTKEEGDAKKKTGRDRKIRAMFLVAPAWSVGDFILPTGLTDIKRGVTEGKIGGIYIYYSRDDRVVRNNDFKKYAETLPMAIRRVFENRGHFNQPKFSEIVKDIKNCCGL